MHFNNPKFEPTGTAKTLLVMLHAYRSTRDDMADAIEAVREAYKNEGGVDIYAPTLPYSHWWDPTGANQIVVKLVGDIDEIWTGRRAIQPPDGHEYDRVILIGHSLGGILVRRVFLAGAPNPPDYAGEYLFRDDLPPDVTGKPHEWAAKVDRIVLLASWDKGWSLSGRNTWWELWLNFLGLWGRIAELAGFETKPGRTMLDMRRGAPFIVQTRLQWMAYRRWHHKPLRDLYIAAHRIKGPEDLPQDPNDPEEDKKPLLVQVIGTLDDFVSPQDQVDYDIDAAEKVAEEVASKITGVSAQHEKNYFLLEMPGADHGGVVKFEGAGEDGRKSVFQCALTVDAPFLSQCAHNCNPAYFEDMPTKPDPKVKDVVFVIHGIRDDGYWTHRIAKAIKEEADKEAKHFESWTHTYGYFAMGPFLLPWVRQQKVEWFMDKYVSVKACYPNATMHYVGHSNGTYLAASALEDYAAARFGRIYFAGSVVHPKFDWSGEVDKKRVEKFHNARGATDWVVALLPKSIEYFADVGGAGFDGFEQATAGHSAITESKRYAKGGHSGAIGEGHWPEIANFIVKGQKPFASGEPLELFDVDQNRWLKFFAGFRIVIPLAFSLVALLVLFFFSWWLPCGHWKWGVREFIGGWGWVIWGTALTAFLMLQYHSKQAPAGTSSRLSFLLILVSGAGVANLILTSFYREAVEFSKLDASRFAVADRTAGAVLTVVGFVALIRFILTRF